jgi:ATPases with chaperone activity, ATP-binding subunit
VDLSVKHIPDRLLPDKAIDVIDEAGARQRLLPLDQRTGKVDVTEVEYIVAKMARSPGQAGTPPPIGTCCATWSAT